MLNSRTLCIQSNDGSYRS